MTLTADPAFTHALSDLPDGSELWSVTAAPAAIGARTAMQVQLEPAIAEHGQPGLDFVDMPTFVVLPVAFAVGTIEVDVLARLTATAPDYARAFAGFAYHVSKARDRFEAVYLRPLNGLRAGPPPPRNVRAVQYFAYPDWKYERLRDEYPEGPFEAGADIGPDAWVRLRLDVSASAVLVTIDGVETLTVDDPKESPSTGAIGLFVDIGTEAYFSNLTVTAAEPSSISSRA